MLSARESAERRSGDRSAGFGAPHHDALGTPCGASLDDVSSVALLDTALAYAGFADAAEFAEWGAQARSDSVSSLGEAMAALVHTLR